MNCTRKKSWQEAYWNDGPPKNELKNFLGSERSSTELAGPGLFYIYEVNFLDKPHKSLFPDGWVGGWGEKPF